MKDHEIKKLFFHDGKLGWTFDYQQIEKVCEVARTVEDVSMEQAEAVMLAMVETGFACVDTK